jgi:hypothetical protein
VRHPPARDGRGVTGEAHVRLGLGTCDGECTVRAPFDAWVRSLGKGVTRGSWEIRTEETDGEARKCALRAKRKGNRLPTLKKVCTVPDGGRVELVEEGIVHDAEDGRLPVNEADRDAHERKAVDEVGGSI